MANRLSPERASGFTCLDHVQTHAIQTVQQELDLSGFTCPLATLKSDKMTVLCQISHSLFTFLHQLPKQIETKFECRIEAALC